MDQKSSTKPRIANVPHALKTTPSLQKGEIPALLSFDQPGFDNHMVVSWNRGTPKSSNLMWLSIINLPFLDTPIYGNPHMSMNES